MARSDSAMKPDVLSILESAYAPAASLDAWFERLVSSARPLLDRGTGFVGHLYAVDDAGRVAVTASSGGDEALSPETIALGQHLVAALNRDAAGREIVSRLYPRAARAATFHELVGGAIDLAALMATSVNDALGVLAGDPSGYGVLLHANTAPPARFGPRERVLWSRVAAHVASAYRLQRRAHAEADAVLHPDGRVAHAEPTAQAPATLAVLRDETRAIDRARGALRRADPAEALAVWRGLVDGQWSLVDQVDSDGRRYVFARRNAPVVRSWSVLSARELQVLAYASEGLSHKAIAYVLGIAAATVSTHLRRAARKVGVATRLELVRAFKARLADAA